jgi:kynureninase
MRPNWWMMSGMLGFEKANDVRRGFARLMDDSPGHIALVPNTHELVVRFLSALPLKKRPKLITTDGEVSHDPSQLDRLAEEGIEVVKDWTDSCANGGRIQ